MQQVIRIHIDERAKGREQRKGSTTTRTFIPVVRSLNQVDRRPTLSTFPVRTPARCSIFAAGEGDDTSPTPDICSSVGE
jgi:hypothetical protein